MEDPGGYVHVTIPNVKRRRRRAGIILHRAELGPRDVKSRDGIRFTAVNRTLVDLCATVSVRALEASLDEALRLGLTTIPGLRRYIRDRRLRNKRGAGALRLLLDDRAEGVMHSEPERIFLRKLASAGLPEPRRQLRVGRRYVDFAYPEAGIAIELDGLGGHFSAGQTRRDKRRDNELVLAGFRPLHFVWDEVERTIRTALRG
jgi:hypothetical protein